MINRYVTLGVISVVLFTSGISIGWYKRGANDAKKTMEAYTKLVTKTDEKRKRKTIVALEEVKRDTETVARLNRNEVKTYVKKRDDNPLCYDTDGLQLVREAIAAAND